MKIAFLSGGTGTPKLLRGFKEIIPHEDISVIVNTAEDMWYCGNHISPDVDTVTYLFADILNTDLWWGIKGDTTITHDYLKSIGEDVFLTLGDKDRAVNILRARLLNSGMTLSEAAREICRRFRVTANIIPMTDSVVTTKILTDNGLIHFQEYWVRHRANVEIRKIVREHEGSAAPQASPGAIEAIRNADAVILGPSNPVTSISPILECGGIVEELKKKFVVSVSPFIGNEPVSGPAGSLMKAWGLNPDSAGAWGLYKDFADLFVQDVRDPVVVDGAVKYDTLMVNRDVSVSLAKEVMGEIEKRI